MLAGVGVFTVVVLFAPSVKQDSPPGWFSVAFPAAAAAIVAILVGLALGDAKFGNASIWLTIVAYIYYAIGAAACLVGLDTTLPAWLYKYLLGAGAAAVVGCLLTTVVVAGRALSASRQAARKANLEAMKQGGTPPPTSAP
jgi:hypothetical protein